MIAQIQSTLIEPPWALPFQSQGIQIMFRSSRLLLVALGAFLGLALWFEGAPSRGQEKTNQDKSKPTEKAADKEKPAPKKIAMKAFMRKKLEASQSVLEGLA